MDHIANKFSEELISKVNQEMKKAIKEQMKEQMTNNLFKKLEIEKIVGKTVQGRSIE